MKTTQINILLLSALIVTSCSSWSPNDRIRQTIIENIEPIRNCVIEGYDEADENPINALVDLNFLVTDTKVEQYKLTVTKGSLPQDVSSCIKSEVLAIQFPQFDSPVEINQPLHFYPRS